MKYYSKLLTAFALLAMHISIVIAQELPIKPERTIAFRTTEGTRMNVDISPDGNHIIFDLLGDLYTVAIPGGKAVQLTRGLAYDHSATWSPDGKYIAYISDKSGSAHCWIMTANGSNPHQLDFGAQLGTEALPAWAPGGRFVAVRGRLYYLAGGEVPMPSQLDETVQFSQDEKYIYYFHQGDTGSGQLGRITDSVKRYDRQSGLIITLPQPAKIFYNPVISPDGHWMAYITGVSDSQPKCDLRILNIQTGENRLLAAGVEQFRPLLERYAFTPGGKQILIGYCGKLHQIDIQTGANDIIPFDAKIEADCGRFDYQTYRVTQDSLAVKYIRNASRSPDGKQLIFGALNKIYGMALPAGKPKQLVNQTDAQFQPVYSPDGKWIAYVTWNDSTAGHLWRVPAHGGEPRCLTSVPAHYQNPAWSPDSKLLAVFSGNYNEYNFRKIRYGSHEIKSTCQVMLIPADGGKTRVIADHTDPRSAIAFSADGKRLLITINANATLLISVSINNPDTSIISMEKNYEVDEADKDQRVKTIVKSFLPSDAVAGFEQIAQSPDGRYFALSIGEDIYLAPSPRLGEQLIIGNKGNPMHNQSPLFRITRDGGIDPHWEQGGEILTWSFGNKFYSVGRDKAVALAMQDGAKIVATNSSKLYSIDPDKSVALAIEGGNQPVATDNMVIPDEVFNIPLLAAKNYAHGTIVLQHARVLTMRGNEVIENGTIVVEDGRITGVGPSGSERIPRGSKKLDLKGKTVMPGLVDIHAHENDFHASFNQQSEKNLTYFAFGVTTRRDPSTDLQTYGEQELIATGAITGSRLFPSGVPLFDPINSLEEARNTVQKRAALGGVLIKQYSQKTRQQRQWVLMASVEKGMNMTNEGSNGLQGDIAMAIDGSSGIEHEYDFPGNMYDDVKHFLAASKTWLTPTLQQNFNRNFGNNRTSEQYFYYHYKPQNDPRMRRFMPVGYIDTSFMKGGPGRNNNTWLLAKTAQMTALQKNGAHIAMGSHGDCVGIGAHYETWGLKMGGMTNMEALQAATIHGAEALGMQQDLGSLEPGKIADLLILDANPLDNIESTLSINYVMKDGILYDSQTLNEIWPSKKMLPEWKWRVEQKNDLK